MATSNTVSVNDTFLRYNITGAWNSNHSMQFNLAYNHGSLPTPWPYVLLSAVVSVCLATWSLVSNVRTNLRVRRGEPVAEIKRSRFMMIKFWTISIFNVYRLIRVIFAVWYSGGSISPPVILLIEMSYISLLLEYNVPSYARLCGLAILGLWLITMVGMVVTTSYGLWAKLDANMWAFDIRRAGLQSCADARLHMPNIKSWTWVDHLPLADGAQPSEFAKIMKQIGYAGLAVGVSLAVVAVCSMCVLHYRRNKQIRPRKDERTMRINSILQAFVLVLMVPFLVVTVYYHYHFQTTPVTSQFYDLQAPVRNDNVSIWVAGRDYPVGWADCFETTSPTDKWGFWDAWMQDENHDWSRRLAVI